MKIMTHTVCAKSIIILLLCLFVSGISQKSYGQEEKIYDHHKDTLVMLENMVLDTYKVLVKREQVLTVDTLKVNLKGMSVASFNFSALSLGANVSLTSKDGTLTDAMKAEIKNTRVNYKFIYFKDIVLKTEDGRNISPSLESIKITFSN